MTAQKAQAKPKAKAKAKEKVGPKANAEPKDDAALKAAVVQAALEHIPFDGFTDAVLARAGKEAGATKPQLARLFPDGPLSLIESFSDWADADMLARLEKAGLTGKKIRERIRLAVRTRLDVMAPYKEAARRAAAFLTMPPHAGLGMKLLYRTTDRMWRAAGDTSTDFNFYTKRAILAGVYSATVMRWFTDESEDESDTDTFLTNRIEDVMRFEKFKAELKKRAKHWPSFGEILDSSARTRR